MIRILTDEYSPHSLQNESTNATFSNKQAARKIRRICIKMKDLHIER
jgi:hypothetical protein